MNVNIVNATPQVIQLGTLDKSMGAIPPKPIVIPTHLPLVLSFAAGGPLTKELVDGGRLTGLYRRETFDRTKPYFTHVTRGAELVSSAGNAIMFGRIIPDDNDTIANTTWYLDVIKDDVNVLTRNADGSIAYDTNGDAKVASTVKGYRLKLIAEYNNDDVLNPVGIKTSKEGYMTDADGNKSRLIPIWEQRASYKGSTYNNVGFGISLPTAADVTDTIKEGNLAMPYQFFMYNRADANSTGHLVKSLFNAEKQQFVFKKGAKDPITSRRVDIKATMDTWYNTGNPLRDLVYPELGDAFIYYENLDMVLKDIMAVEKDYVNADVTIDSGDTVNTHDWMDYVIDVDADLQYGIINPFSALSTKRVPAFTYVMDETAITADADHKEIYPSITTPCYLGKGKDGTLSEENLEKGVKVWMDKYSDINSEVMDSATNIENVLYDTGFRLATKKELTSFIGTRKDTFLGLSTREDYLGDKVASLIDERALALNLKAALALVPESTFFGTGVARAMIVGGSGNDNLDPSGRRYGLLMDIMYKTAKMMGGTAWKANLLFARGDKNIILNYSNIEPSFIPKGIKPDLWNIGLITPEPYDRESYHFPALQSAYDNDTSALNNIFMAIALTTSVKVADAAGRKFSGDISLSPSQLVSAVETYMNGELKDKFAGIIDPVAKAQITDYDANRGYSWTAVTKLSGEVMKTVMTHHVEVYRK